MRDDTRIEWSRRELPILEALSPASLRRRAAVAGIDARALADADRAANTKTKMSDRATVDAIGRPHPS